MQHFIFTERNGIHIIDLQQTVTRLDEAIDFVREVVAGGNDVLIIGTKKQARETVEQEAQRAGLPYVNNRWLGGTLTNFRTIQARIRHMRDLEDRTERGSSPGARRRSSSTSRTRSSGSTATSAASSTWTGFPGPSSSSTR